MATLLIVDDDNLVRDTLHELLSAAHECHTADRAEQALAYLDIETYDAVLTTLICRVSAAANYCDTFRQNIPRRR